MTKINQVIKAIRGMNDLLPNQSTLWQQTENKLKAIAQHYGYHEIRFPVLEQTKLFKRSVGEATDIVEKEMYSFDDRNGDNLSLRPEGTACCVRAAIEHGLLYNQTQKLWYLGPFYRHERPQKGRYRQFHQLGLEAFGVATPDIDAETIILTARIFQALNLKDQVSLQLNSIGTIETRKKYAKILTSYFSQAEHKKQLDEDSLRRLTTNPMRILDSKNPALAEIIKTAPKMLDHLDPSSKIHFDKVLTYLNSAGISYQINPIIVRGLDYYNDTVFEWVTDKLGAQATVCAGGRYDGLVEQLGGKPCPAIGFALGIERLILLLEAQTDFVPVSQAPDAYLIIAGVKAQSISLKVAEQLRALYPNTLFTMHCGDASIKSQLKKADKSGAKLALILGDEEVEQQKITVKYLREEKAQKSVEITSLEFK